MDIRNKRDEIYAALMVELEGFKGLENSRAARTAIARVIDDSLRQGGPLRRLSFNVSVGTETEGVALRVKTRDPAVIAMAANAGLLADPAAIGLERVEGSHGAVWVWPEVVLVDEVFT